MFDVAIVGAGIAGLIHLHYARRAGLDALVLEAKPALGGLWRELPAWQDIQISCADWAVGDLPLAGPLQPQILANLQAWADRLALREPAQLAGRRAMVVGGGASAFDLIDQCLQHGAQQLKWVYRGTRWFVPTTRPKAIAGSVRPFARMQLRA